MDYELISLVFGLAIFGGLVWLLSHVSFKQGMEIGKRMAVAPVSRSSRAFAAQPAPTSDTDSKRKECPICRVWVYSEGHLNQHLAEHERLGESSKPKPDRRRWMGFSRIKAELESKESA